MFDNTKKRIKEVGRTLKIIGLVFKIIGQLFPIIYLIYLIHADIGSMTANIIFLVLALLYFGFFLFMELRTFNKKVKRTVRKWVNNVYRWSKRLIRLLLIVIPSYGLVLTVQNSSPLAIFLLILTIIGIVLELIWSIFASLFKRLFSVKKKKFVNSFKQDVSDMFPRETSQPDQNDFSDFGNIQEET